MRRPPARRRYRRHGTSLKALELIKAEQEPTQIKNIATDLNISYSIAHKIIAKLKKDGKIEFEEYGYMIK